MRIISPFHDYYDGVMRTSFDPGILYIREEKIEEFDSHPLLPERMYGFDLSGGRKKSALYTGQLYSKDYRGAIESMLLLFCGTAYPLFVLHVERIENGILLGTDEKVVKCFLSAEEARFYFHAHYGDEVVDAKRYRYRDIDVLRVVKELEAMRGRVVDSYLAEDKVPIELLRLNKIDSTHHKGFVKIMNPQLKQFGFHQILDPYTAFQEIFMYVGGVLSGIERPMVKLSDKEQIVKKGFDKVRSFRKMPRS